MNIRRATNADTGVMRRLWDEFTVEATFAPYPGNPFQSALVTDHIALLAEEDGAPVGTVYANLASPHFGFVFGLYTIPAARGKGVGRALMREIAAVLRDQGRRYVLLNVDTPNEDARAFYERLGFTDAARMLRADVEDLLHD
ncbi:MAG: GNAT family N-acetyltransferase [Gaiellaceae bacterium]|jgi:ribosomal protein S18 acetylase RimI-like enzyme